MTHITRVLVLFGSCVDLKLWTLILVTKVSSFVCEVLATIFTMKLGFYMGPVVVHQVIFLDKLFLTFITGKFSGNCMTLFFTPIYMSVEVSSLYEGLATLSTLKTLLCSVNFGVECQVALVCKHFATYITRKVFHI